MNYSDDEFYVRVLMIKLTQLVRQCSSGLLLICEGQTGCAGKGHSGRQPKVLFPISCNCFARLVNHEKLLPFAFRLIAPLCLEMLFSNHLLVIASRKWRGTRASLHLLL